MMLRHLNRLAGVYANLNNIYIIIPTSYVYNSDGNYKQHAQQYYTYIIHIIYTRRFGLRRGIRELIE